MSEEMPHDHERRFHGGAERLHAPERVALLETGAVTRLCAEGIDAESVLDVGTGTGIFAEAFAGQSFRVTGIDPNRELLAVARAQVPSAAFREGVAEKLPFDDASFDLVFLGHVLHETDNPDAALREAKRVARKRVAILEWPYRKEDMGPPLEHRLQSSRITDLAGRAGFTAVERIELTHMDFYRLTP
ncbi:MAG: class I SAM-dependent methyltransferase [Spirochaetia bacterium]|jgi:ubiquinone/menaquinone biosynthesis C-methylase UbiE